MGQLLDTTSLSGAEWHSMLSLFSAEETERRALALHQSAGIPHVLCQFLAAKGIGSDALDAFIEPRLRDSLPDPLVMQDADKAISLITDAIEAKTPIGLFGDYDVDGACSAALFSLCLAQFGVQVFCHIPDRFDEGYGPNTKGLLQLAEQGAELVLTVDCGITAHAPLEAAAQAGIPVIVIDHHKAGPVLPQAQAVVNPNRLDDDSQLGSLCAAGVCFLVLAGVLRECRSRNIPTLSGQQVQLLDLLDLVALATVCDVMPLTGLNRVFVKQGLKVLSKRQNTGLKTLMDTAKIDHMPNAYSLGFILGPRINAGGRLGNSSIGVQLLCASDRDIAQSLAWHLDELNTQRQHIEKQVRAQAEEMAYSQLDENPNRHVLVLAREGWHEGVLGIVAGRLKEKLNKIVIVISLDEEGIGKGSARSVSGFSLGDTVLAAGQHGLVLSGGGHDLAAGLSVRKTQLSDFQNFMEDAAEKSFSSGMPAKRFDVSGSLSVGGCTLELITWLTKLGPFGSGYPEPRFRLTHCQLKNMRWIGGEKQHLSLSLDDGTAPPLRAVMFNCADTPLGQTLKNAHSGDVFQLIGKLQEDSYRNNGTVQMIIDDIALQSHR